MGERSSKRFAARVIVVLIVPDKAPEREDGVGAQQSRPRWSDVEGFDLRSLVGWAERIARWIGLASVENVVEAVWILEPRPCESQIKLDRICFRELIINPVKYVLLIALGMNNGELRRVEKSTRIQSAWRR